MPRALTLAAVLGLGLGALTALGSAGLGAGPAGAATAAVDFGTLSCGSSAFSSAEAATAPLGTTSVSFTIEGAGGSGGDAGNNPSGSGATGGAGGDAAKLVGTIPISGTPTLYVQVGCGGTSTGVGGSGYTNGGSAPDSSGGAGGGATGLCLGTTTADCSGGTVEAIAAGGGGGGSGAGDNDCNKNGGAGGNGDGGTASTGGTSGEADGNGVGGGRGTDGGGGDAGHDGGGGAGGTGQGPGQSTGTNPGNESAGVGGTGSLSEDNGSSGVAGPSSGPPNVTPGTLTHGGAGNTENGNIGPADSGGGGGGLSGGGGGGAGLLSTGDTNYCDGGGGGGAGSSWVLGTVTGVTFSTVSGTATCINNAVSATDAGEGAAVGSAHGGCPGYVTATWTGSAPAAPSPKTATFTEGVDGSATIASATGTSYAESGTLPPGLSFQSSTGKISGTPSSGDASSYSVTVTASNTFGSSSASTVTIDIDDAATSTTLSSSADPSAAGASVTYSATVAPTVSNAITPSGTVEFEDGGNDIAGCSSQALDQSSPDVATCVVAPGTYTASGSHAITAVYSGDTNFTGSTASTLTQSVTTGPAAQLVFSTEPPASGAAGVALSPAFSVSVEDAFGNVETTGTGSTDTITLGVASGPGDGSIASGASATASGGVATFSDAVIDVAGSYTLSGADSSEDAISGATSTSVDIAPAASSVVVTSSANPSGYAKAVTLTATVTGNDSLGAPTGTVEFDDLTYSDTVIAGCATAPLSASGSDTSTATCTYTPKATGGTGGTFTVVATSSGDSSYGGSASPAFSQVMLGSGHALLALSFSENPVPYSGSVTLTATLTFTSGSGTPGGTISFVDLTDTQTLCTAMAPTGVDHQATCAFSLSPDGTEGGVFSLEATYSGDSDYAFADDHQTLTELGDDQASVAVTSSKPDKAATEGQTMVLYATVSGAEGTPSGSAVFSVDGSPITCVGLVSTSVHVNPEGEAVCKWQPEAAGTYAVTAGYSGDTTYAPLATSPTYDQLVDGKVVTTAATPQLTSAGPAIAGEPITVTDTVSASAGQVTTGDVAFSETISGTTSVACASEPVDATGTASCTFTPFAGSVGGAVKVTASYLGSGDDAPSAASPSLSVPVLGANLLSSFVVTSNADPAGAAKVVTLTATLSGSVGTPTGTPTGTATFTDDGTVISCNGGTTPPKLSGSMGTATATCRYTPSGAGSDTIDASYGGDVDYAPASTPADFTQEVDGTGAVTSVAVTSAADPNAYDTSVTLTATVAAPSTPTGTVDFSATVAGQQADLCPAAVLSGTGGVATASCVYDPAVEGNAGQVATIRATYSGDATYAPKGSGVFTQTEDGTASLDAFTLTSNLNPSGSNKVVTFTATLTGQTTPTGTVTFTDAGTPICTAAKLSASGVAICHLALSGAGDHLIAATYSGDATYAAATSPSDLDQQVS